MEYLYKKKKTNKQKLTLYLRHIGVILSVRPSVCPSVRPSVFVFFSSFFCVFALDLSNYWTIFIQTSQIDSIHGKDVHIVFRSWFIELLLKYCPLMKFVQVTPGQYSVTRSNFLARTCCGYSSLLVIALA